jgi:chromosomal replication initiator protein
MPVRTQSSVDRRSADISPAARLGEHLARRIGRHKFDMWFGHSTRLLVEGERLEVATDSQFVADWIGHHFKGELNGAAREVLGERARIDVRVSPHLFGRHMVNGKQDGKDPGKDANGTATRDGSPPRRRGRGADARSSSTRLNAVVRRLEDFIVGPSNRMAFTAACRLAESSDGDASSPLFIHADCGMGKTHLLQGICHRFAQHCGRPQLVRYVTGEQFTNEYIAAVRNRKIDEFRAKHRKLELLAIDDVHFLSAKVATQSEFLHTIDAIGLQGSRLVLASDEHPRHVKRFSQSLVSRFVSGMIVKIESPDLSTRRSLVKRLATSRGLTIGEGAIDSIASRWIGSVRELEGVVTRLAAIHLLDSEAQSSEDIGLVAVNRLMQDASLHPATPVRVESIIDVVCEQLAVSRTDLLGTTRHRRVVLARSLVAFLAREMTTRSFPEIASALGRSYHSTVHSAARRLKEQILQNELIERDGQGPPIAIREFVDQLRHQIVRSTGQAA